MALSSPASRPDHAVADAERQRARRGAVITGAILVVLIALVVLLTPVTEDSSDTRLTTSLYGPGNARLASAMARSLGWPVTLASAPLSGALDTSAIYAVFDGPTPMSSAERHALLDAVRRGASLLVSPAAGAPSQLLDSLGLDVTASGMVQATPLGKCPADADPMAALRVRPRMATFEPGPDAIRVGPRATTERKPPSGAVRYPVNATTLLASVVTVDSHEDDDADDSADSSLKSVMPGDSVVVPANSVGKPADSLVAAKNSAVKPADSVVAAKNSAVKPADTLVKRMDSVRTSAPRVTIGAPKTSNVNDTTELRPTVVAFALGKGRVVAIADPDILRTDQLRNCAMGTALTVVRSLEYLSPGAKRTIVFAEYYQGARTGDGAMAVISEWLRGTAPGRTLLTMMLAGAVLLLARGRRTLAPVYRAREERRSALEHVDALATAWRAVRGTRTAARMLARGIRRRHAAGRWRALDDTAFLAALAARHPAIDADVALLTLAMDASAAPSELITLRRAAAHIDAECLTP
jgi:hypothetical protein